MTDFVSQPKRLTFDLVRRTPQQQPGPLEMSRGFFMGPEGPDTRVVGMRSEVRYVPVMKYVPCPEPGDYRVYRMTYRGGGGWSWPLASGSLHKLLKRYLRHVGTDEFFKLL